MTTAHKSAAALAREFFEANKEAMLAGSEVLWPEEEDLYTLMQMRVESGHAAFEREKQGSPVDPELCEWPESYFENHIWFDSWDEIERATVQDAGSGMQGAGKTGRTYESLSPASCIPHPPLVIKTMALDPSKGRDSHRGDYSAYVMLGIDAAGVIYVEADLARRPTPQMVADGVACYQRFQALSFGPVLFGIEANQYQELLAGEFLAEFARQGLAHVAPAGLHNHVNKQVRIRRLGPYLSQRRLRFRAGSASTRLLVDQLRDFPAAAHDDGPDALEMALRLAEEILHGRNTDDGLGNRLMIDDR